MKATGHKILVVFDRSSKKWSAGRCRYLSEELYAIVAWQPSAGPACTLVVRILQAAAAAGLPTMTSFGGLVRSRLSVE